MWVPIKGYEGFYELNEHGIVRRVPGIVVANQHGGKKFLKGRVLKPNLGVRGYYTVNLTKENKKKNVAIHRLVAEHFMDPPNDKEKTDINHINGIKTDNRIKNLEWISRGENVRHAYKIGLHDQANKTRRLRMLCKSNKISYEIAGEIRFMYESSGLSQKQIGEIYNVSQVLVGKIVRNEMWNVSETEKVLLASGVY